MQRRQQLLVGGFLTLDVVVVLNKGKDRGKITSCFLFFQLDISG
jgi:hypothetical protein